MTVTSRDMASPDETKTFDRGQIQSLTIGGSSIRRNTFEPGWRWSESVGPSLGMDSCPVHHVGFVLSGRLHVKTEDGGEAEIGPGEAYEIQPGHDGWVAGDETLVAIEFTPPT